MADEDRKKETYVVGPGRPPLETRFKPGVTGNRRGRPKGSVSAGALLKKTGLKKVPVTEGGRRKLVTREQYALHAIVNKAMKGDLKAMEIYLRETAKISDESASRAELIVPDLDRATKRKIAERMLRDVEELEAGEAASDRAAREQTR